jgi:carboxylate-amine ligase
VKRDGALPKWAHWNADPLRPAWTVGIEEEVMLLDPETWRLAHRIEQVLPELSPDLSGHVGAETHACTLELATGIHQTVGAACAELLAMRTALAEQLAALGLRAGVAGTHPAPGDERTRVSAGARYRVLERGLRDLARREPTFALHVHVGVPLPDLALAAADRLRAHLPLILALSANSPFWRARDSGMASVRTPLFQAFPRSGIPRRFDTYPDYVESIDVLLRADAFPEPTFVWWDVRLQPRFGTVEVRIADAQSTVGEVAAIAALIQVLVRLEATERFAPEALLDAPEVLAENRFLASRDGMRAELIDPSLGGRMPAERALAEAISAGLPHARDVGCSYELGLATDLGRFPGAERQRQLAGELGFRATVEHLCGLFLDPAGVNQVERAAGEATPL